jgi:predicted nuclease of predicted toxin-antitoxin system
MKIKLDENLPFSLVGELSRLGHQVDTVPQEGISGAADKVVWEKAQKEERLFITQDLDFSNIHLYAPGTHHGLILIRLRVPGRIALIKRLLTVFNSEDVENWKKSFVIISDLKIRVHHPD